MASPMGIAGMRIVVSEAVAEPALALLRARGPVYCDPGLHLRPADLRAAVADAAALVVRNRTRVSADLLAAAPGLRVIGRLGTGLDNIDLGAAAQHGVAVVFAPGGNAVSVAEMTIGLILALAKKIPGASADTHRGGWHREKWSGMELAGKTLAILGLGRIGRLVAWRARSFGMRLAASHPRLRTGDPEIARLGVALLPLNDLLAAADILTIHLPLTPETRGLLDGHALRRMKPGALLVNAGRGGVIDERALLDALRSGRLGGAALDVRACEPPRPDPLAGLPNVILTPHVAGLTREALERVDTSVAADVVRVLQGEAPRHPAPPPPA